MPAHSKRQQATYESPTPTVAAATSSSSESLADSAATRFVPPATSTSSTTTDTSSYQSVLDIWQYIILVVVILGAIALGSTVCIFRKKSRIARARRAARQAAAAAAEEEGADDLSLRSRGGGTAHWDDLEDAVSMSELQSTHVREEVLPPPAYQERRRSSGLSSFVTTATTSDTRPSTGDRSRSSFTSQLKRFPSAIGSFLNKRVQPTLGGTSVSTDELQTRSAEAQLEAARRRRPPSQATPRRSSSSSSVFAFSPRRTSSSGEVSTSRLQTDPPSADTLEQVRNIRRALSDAGLLFAPPRSLSDRRLSTGSLSGTAAAAGGNRPAVLATMHEGLRTSTRSAEQEEEEVERELARQERRARRRRRRERERQRAEDEAGLPTYSREVAEGEAVLERAEGWKSEEEDEEEEEGSDGFEHVRGIRRSEDAEERTTMIETALLPPDPGPDGHSR